MNNPLGDVPLNTLKIFVVEKTVTGCEIYMPVIGEYDIINKKMELREFLNNQFPPIEPIVS